MGPGSILLALAAFLMMVGGIFLTLVPVLGSVMSFGAPVVALAGLIVGGMGYSRARREGVEGGPAIVGMVLSGTAFLLSLVFAVFCGTCNACLTAGTIQGPGAQPFWLDAGTRLGPAPVVPRAPLPGAPGASAVPDPGGTAAPNPAPVPDPGGSAAGTLPPPIPAPVAPADPSAPPPAFPPPPVPVPGGGGS
ncbi:MAG: hypothetical protein AAGH15_16515 [Myxococcota bacterium]